MKVEFRYPFCPAVDVHVDRDGIGLVVWQRIAQGRRRVGYRSWLLGHLSWKELMRLRRKVVS